MYWYGGFFGFVVILIDVVLGIDNGVFDEFVEFVCLICFLLEGLNYYVLDLDFCCENDIVVFSDV